MIDIIDKFKDIYLAKHLHHNEFKCRCERVDCNFTIIDSQLLYAWECTRLAFNKPLEVNSGFRCQGHNKESGGVFNSKHLRARAIDISTQGLNTEDKNLLTGLCYKYFSTVIEYETFLHCHV